jgi:hypothetical protein
MAHSFLFVEAYDDIFKRSLPTHTRRAKLKEIFRGFPGRQFDYAEPVSTIEELNQVNPTAVLRQTPRLIRLEHLKVVR